MIQTLSLRRAPLGELSRCDWIFCKRANVRLYASLSDPFAVFVLPMLA